MQEQNKKPTAEEGKDKAHNHSRKRGYFMEPPSAAKKNTSPAESSENNKPQDNKRSDGAHHQKRNHNSFKKRSPEQKNVSQNAEKSASEQTQQPAKQQPKAPAQKPQNANASEQKTPDAPQKSKNKNRNRNKNNAHKQTDNAQNQKAVPVQKTVEVKKDNKPVNNHSADDYEEYKLVADDTHEVVNKKETAENNPDEPKTEVVGIRFKSSGKVYYFDPKGRSFKRGSSAIVDTARGQEFGEVAMPNTMIRTSDIVPPLRVVVRGATTADVEHHKSNKKKEEEAFKLCCEKIAEHGLDMKLIDAQYTFDNSKLLFYFTSSDRVDFRELVKDLASVFRTRIELRQIGIRDEAKLMGGLGMCGRPLCCTLFLSDFDQVSIKMAKEQNLSLNSAKISGICGRLMCCLKYEHEAYEYEIKRTPPVDSLVRTENGDGIVTEINPLQRTIKVRLLASPEVPPKTYKRDDVTMLRKKQSADNK